MEIRVFSEEKSEIIANRVLESGINYYNYI